MDVCKQQEATDKDRLASGPYPLQESVYCLSLWLYVCMNLYVCSARMPTTYTLCSNVELALRGSWGALILLLVCVLIIQVFGI